MCPPRPRIKTSPIFRTVDAVEYSKNASYIHICENNTIYGTRFTKLPHADGVPLVADLSSCILSRPTDVSQYGLIYFGVQKNVAPAGMAVAIIREDLMENARTDIARPAMLDYKTLIDAESMYNTPPCYTIYMMGLVLKWIETEVGGLANMEARNNAKAKLLYDYLDGSVFLQQSREQAGPQHHERHIHQPQPGAGQKILRRSRGCGLCQPEGTPHAWAACALPSIMPCPPKAWKSWWNS